MDGWTLRRLARELDGALRGARIDRIYQPGERDLVLAVRSAQLGARRLYMSAHQRFARVHFLADERPDNPPTPPMFCVILRKHIEGGRIVGVTQPGWDRVLEIGIEALDDLGDRRTYALICEIMGRHSNIVLVEERSDDSRVIIDSAVRVTEEMSRYRAVLPGIPYLPPPPQGKKPVEQCAPEDFLGVDPSAGSSRANQMAVVEKLAGTGPVTAREILHRAIARTGYAEAASIYQASIDLAAVVDEVREPASVGLDDVGRAVECAPFRLTCRPRFAECDTVSEAIRRLFADVGESLHQSRLARELERSVRDHMDRLRGKLVRLEQEWEDAEAEEQLRVKAELLTAYAHEVPRGASEVELPNYYDDNQPLRIDLDPALDAIANAQRLFRMAAKRKRARQWIEMERENTRRDLRYLEDVLQSLADTSLENLEEVRRELEAQGFLARSHRRGTGSKKRSREAEPHAFRSSDGFVIRVGRNNAQNDRLTFRRADKRDVWLHVKDAPGSHVVIERGQADEIPERTVEEAAVLAAYFSKMRDSANVPVDVTEIRHVWKPNGARPGFALYDHQKTLFVTPERSLLDSIMSRALATRETSDFH
ncbi:NFACT family protein [Alicyclobacillus mali]|uniref:Rqc2 homolog RqcH n=1 Tax=Alicyclobacillus mali (ex Roth et al. 2021) TaxID=1123961 RepID=A0ABS0F2T9_9BACL|nr:NFACT family protein [Alicyclobacillus mali (ex Roth et al. 2021)]MBF8377604.1 NFACT family protein [Alicyclobacillus mali (ex Roth et al. 2021)]